MSLTRADVETKLLALQADGNQQQTKAAYTTAITAWLQSINSNAIDQSQILKDLESYTTYKNLIQ